MNDNVNFVFLAFTLDKHFKKDHAYLTFFKPLKHLVLLFVTFKDHIRSSTNKRLPAVAVAHVSIVPAPTLYAFVVLKSLVC